MRFVSSLNTLATTLFLVAAGNAGIALAHTQSGSLGSAEGATDLYQVTCSTDAGGATDRLEMKVQGTTSGSGRVSVQTRRGSIATNATDPSAVDAAYSSATYNNSGNGAYNVLVNKTKSGTKNYTLDYHCQTSTGVHTGTSTTTIQNQ